MGSNSKTKDQFAGFNPSPQENTLTEPIYKNQLKAKTSQQNPIKNRFHPLSSPLCLLSMYQNKDPQNHQKPLVVKGKINQNLWKTQGLGFSFWPPQPLVTDIPSGVTGLGLGEAAPFLDVIEELPTVNQLHDL